MRILGIALLVAMVGCGGDDDGSDGPGVDGSTGGSDAAGQGGEADAGADEDAAVGELTRHIISPACGPADGPALRIQLGAAGAAPCAIDEAAPSVRLDAWTQDIVAPMTISWAPGEALGTGSLCPGGEDTCRTYSAGDITFQTFDAEQGAAGTWRLLEGDQPVTGTFDATWCEPKVPDPCG
ncbi:MAG TPA: hypothetical protein VNO33_07140 [Kofleriaceae bacterium]|nr:hypothetical protein [Kofleriaceae bacterium]